jgi:molybdopterin-guanine dinucleotide biosynthesis protein A
MIEDCTAIILAGGDSQRMGSDKANLLLGEQTLLRHVIATMQKIFPHVIVSVRQLRPEIDLPQVCDEQASAGKPPGGGPLAGAGPLAGLAASLDHVTTPWAFAVACDMPFVEPAMVELLGRYRSHYQAVVPVVQGHPQPLAAFYAGTCRATIRAHFAGGGKNSLRAALEKLQVRYVDEADLLQADPALRSFFDLDTPQDVAMARRRY